ncbi:MULTISPECIES: dihydrolipoamide acetyltransferase family protein [Pontibacillus]|uniref:Dihydrolipoamide acetyltransferase component of pyruvate dehydrogenase complex n=1 Tax=Pontibacillus chungwhensis TaxID=265426 RepID=A0ABY8UTY6_9BACI|nr:MULTISPECIES: dihydrolipoamide acetyltransferase family protein [Pontibacillus]MCD5323275.1 2-oxo acid dehydrogenase subunit E2 [Pontibacillus sp. HN14]WIF96658.1 dihydrolipoamide acetyltransferase family protein [Pontibacillus chungwhensis]
MVEVKLHDIGEGMTEAEILHFFVKPGDEVAADEPLVEVQTDKMTAEIPSPGAGIIGEILVELGETITVGTTVLNMDVGHKSNSGKTSSENTKKSSEKSDNQGEVHTFQLPKRSERILAAPYTRKIARDNGVDISQVEGTGPGGRIVDEDVLAYMKGDTGKQSVAVADPSFEKEPVMAKQEVEPVVGQSIPFKGRRKQIAKKMTHSLHTIAHCTQFEEVDVTNAMEWRAMCKEQGKVFSIAAFYIKAVSVALKDFPIFNATLDEQNEKIDLKEAHNIGLAVDTEDGLIVPVLRNVESKSITQIHEEMKALTEKALSNQLSMADIQGGTFTISNVGPLKGSTGATPIINHPETGLIALHKTKKKPAVVNDEIVIRSMMNISFTFDHRVADGGTAVAFSNRLVQLMEHPNTLMLELV